MDVLDLNSMDFHVVDLCSMNFHSMDLSYPMKILFHSRIPRGFSKSTLILYGFLCYALIHNVVDPVGGEKCIFG